MSDDARVRALNVEIEEFKRFIDKFSRMFSQEHFNYNLLESQFENLKNRNKKLQEENQLAEARIRDAIQASEKIRADADAYQASVKANMAVLYQTANVKYKELEEKLNGGERKAIQKHLKELEAVV